MTEAEFLSRWHAERPLYEAWGGFIVEEIRGALERGGVRVSYFLKILPVPRVKEPDSLLGKAFYRNKPYQDPYAEIEDKVGVRFVVLLTKDIAKLDEAIVSSERWSYSLDRDYEEEKSRKPLEFAYQSKHYVLRSRGEQRFNGVVIPDGTPCEVQLRTLLQHAHSELTHDTIYKGDGAADPRHPVHRTVAKSMALVEAADDFFIQVFNQLEQASQSERDALLVLDRLYRDFIGFPPNHDKSNGIVLGAFKAQLEPNLRERLERLLNGMPFIVKRIRERSVDQYVYRQPWVLLAYLLASESPHATADRWPLTPEEIRPIYIDLGKKMPD